MSKIETNHEIVGKTISSVVGLDIGTFYPVTGADRRIIIGVFSAEFGTPPGYRLDHGIQAFVPVDANV